MLTLQFWKRNSCVSPLCLDHLWTYTFLSVFVRRLQDVEANTVRLKEHGQDVLVLEKIPANIKAADGSLQIQYK